DLAPATVAEVPLPGPAGSADSVHRSRPGASRRGELGPVGQAGRGELRGGVRQRRSGTDRPGARRRWRGEVIRLERMSARPRGAMRRAAQAARTNESGDEWNGNS